MHFFCHKYMALAWVHAYDFNNNWKPFFFQSFLQSFNKITTGLDFMQVYSPGWGHTPQRQHFLPSFASLSSFIHLHSFNKIFMAWFYTIFVYFFHKYTATQPKFKSPGATLLNSTKALIHFTMYEKFRKKHKNIHELCASRARGQRPSRNQDLNELNRAIVPIDHCKLSLKSLQRNGKDVCTGCR